MALNRGYFHHLACGSVVWYQVKQALALFALFAVGYLFLKVIQHHLSELWVCMLAFPTAVCLWCFCSEFLLLADFTYRFWRVCFLIGAGTLACYLFRRARHIPIQPVTFSSHKAESADNIISGKGVSTGAAIPPVMIFRLRTNVLQAFHKSPHARSFSRSAAFLLPRSASAALFQQAGCM